MLIEHSTAFASGPTYWTAFFLFRVAGFSADVIFLSVFYLRAVDVIFSLPSLSRHIRRLVFLRHSAASDDIEPRKQLRIGPTGLERLLENCDSQRSGGVNTRRVASQFGRITDGQ